LKPSVPVVEFADEYGNVCQRLIAPPGPFSIHTSADVMTSDTIDVISGYDQVACISDWIHRTLHSNPVFEYDYMSAIEVNQRREGVCCDFAHLGIALCRGLCIPACMVVGYLHGLQSINLHAWFEAYVNGRWYTFDATQSVPLGRRVTVAYGHDAANVAIFSQFGPALSPSVMQVSVELLEITPEGSAFL